MEAAGLRSAAGSHAATEARHTHRYADLLSPASASAAAAAAATAFLTCEAAERRTALVLYGSETGSAQDVAEETGRLVERWHFDTTVLDLDSVHLRDVLKPAVVLFVLSTTGQGEMPQNARASWKTLLSSALKPGVLRKLRFSSFGLGDSSYPQYNVAHRMLHGRLLQLGARTFCERGEGNEQHPEGHSAGLREWMVLLKQRLAEAFPLPEGVQAIPEDVFIEPKWKLEKSPIGNGTIASASGPHPGCRPVETPSVDVLPTRGSHQARIESNERITPNKHFQDVRVLDMRCDEPIQYGPGAVAVIYPKNFPEDVDSFVELMSWQDIADKPLSLVSSSRDASTPSPLRHLDTSRINLTIRWLLENVLDIMSIPRRTFFAELAHFANASNEDEAYQKERLLELANPELIDELWDYTTRPKRTILEVMMDFTTIKIPWQYVLSVLPIMKGRQFSIASGGALKRDDQNRTRIQLLIAIVDPPSPIIKWRRRYGVCTRYIAALQADQHIAIGLQPGYLDVQPSELHVPVIMIGPGTGLAPMRSLIHQRLEWTQQQQQHTSPSTDPPLPLAGDILFFGCRSPDADDFFRDEWDRLAHPPTSGLRVHTAFSRAPDRPRQYVQDQIRLHGARVRDALVRRAGRVYVCGASGDMPKGVRRAIADALVEHSAAGIGDGDGGDVDGDMTMTEREAEEFLDRLGREGRYKQETW